MRDLILVGSGGGMREILWQLEEVNKRKPTWNILGIVDKEEKRQITNIYGYPLLGDDNYLLEYKKNINVAICVGSSSLRKRIACILSKNPFICFPNLVANDVKIAERSIVGRGCFIGTNSVISVDTLVEDFVFINIGSLISHDCKLRSFVTLSPDTKLAGNVTIGEGTEMGIGSRVIQGITIGESAKIGAGAVVIRDIPSECTAVGIPAKVIK